MVYTVPLLWTDGTFFTERKSTQPCMSFVLHYTTAAIIFVGTDKPEKKKKKKKAYYTQLKSIIYDILSLKNGFRW